MKPMRHNQVGASNNLDGDNRIEFVPPTDEMIDLFARKVCESMGRLNSAYASADVRHGLGSYLKLVTSIAARRKNEEQSEGSDQLLDSEGQ